MSRADTHDDGRAPCALIVGASAGLGRALAVELAGSGYTLLLCARNKRDLDAVAADCRIRHNVQVDILPLDLSDPDGSHHLAEFCRNASTRISRLFITAGTVSPDDEGFPDVSVISAIHTVNYVTPAKIISDFLRNRHSLGLKSIVVVSSIAARVPRARNCAYAAAKIALESFCISMQVTLSRTSGKNGVDTKLQVYRVGYMDTGLSFGQKLLLPVISTETAARRIIRDVNKDSFISYLPGFWRYVVGVLRRLPRAIYNRLNF